jgi:hypothetical protein
MVRSRLTTLAFRSLSFVAPHHPDDPALSMHRRAPARRAPRPGTFRLAPRQRAHDSDWAKDGGLGYLEQLDRHFELSGLFRLAAPSYGTATSHSRGHRFEPCAVHREPAKDLTSDGTHAVPLWFGCGNPSVKVRDSAAPYSALIHPSGRCNPSFALRESLSRPESFGKISWCL